MFELAVVVALVLAVVALIRLQDATTELRALRRRLDELEKHGAPHEQTPRTHAATTSTPAGPATEEARATAGSTSPATSQTEPEPLGEEVFRSSPDDQAPIAAEPERSDREAKPGASGERGVPVRPLAPLPASLRRDTPASPPMWDDDEPLPVVGRRASTEDDWGWFRSGDRDGKNSGEGAATFEARFGSTWLLRIGLVFLILAAALFAVVVTPRVGAGGKVALGYVFAALLFGAGLLSSRLRNFARPVMAGGLSLAFFISYAAYFVEAMRCLPLTVSLTLMGLFVGAILVSSDRWRSEFTGGLAVFLGHAATFVAGRNLESGAPASLVAVIFLSVAAVVLLLRHSWTILSLLAVVAAYGSHLVWVSLTESVATPQQALYVNLAFLSSYYLIFAISDALWWRRRLSAGTGAIGSTSVERDGEAGTASAMGLALGPLNLVLYTSIVSLLYLETEVHLHQVHFFYFALAAVQAVLALTHRNTGGTRYLFYPAAATVLLTLGFFSAFERLALNLVLAAEAMVLLVVAHQTRLRLFHLLSQAALAANFVHYWVYASTIDSNPARYIGGMLTAGVYLVKSGLEEIWYGRESGFAWIETRPASKLLRELSDAFDRAYGMLTPVLPHLHAAGGALILVHQCGEFLSPADAGLVLSLGVLGFAAVGAWRESVPLLIASTTVYAGLVTLQGFDLPSFSIPASSDFPEAWRVGINGAGAGAAVLGFGRLSLRRVSPSVRYGLFVWPCVTFALFLFAYGVAPRPEVAGGAPFALGTLGLLTGTVALERLAASRRSVRPASSSATAAIVAFEVASGLAIAAIMDTHFEWRFGEAPVRYVLLAGLACALSPIGLARRSAGVYSAGALLMVLVFGAIFPSGAARETLYASLPAAVAVALPMVGVAWAQDFMARLFDELLTPAQRRLTPPVIGLPYALGMVLLMDLAAFRLEAPWHLPVQAGLAAGLMGATRPLSLQRGAVFAIFAYAASALIAMLLRGGEALQGWQYLAAVILVIGAGFFMERVWSWGERRPGAEKTPDLELIAAGRVVLIVAATLVALSAARYSMVLGVKWTTAAWAVYAALVMIMGFAWRQAAYRRTALGVLALCIARVLLVDIRNLETLYQAIALLVLGLCLVAIAWLYSRFSDQLRRWL